MYAEIFDLAGKSVLKYDSNFNEEDEFIKVVAKLDKGFNIKFSQCDEKYADYIRCILSFDKFGDITFSHCTPEFYNSLNNVNKSFSMTPPGMIYMEGSLSSSQNAEISSIDDKSELGGIRYNQDKLRVDLVSPYAVEKMAEVLTKGCEKYPANNWRKGLPWMKGVASSLERHLLKFKQGEDYDKESGLLHVSHIATNAMFLIEYYKTRREFDDRKEYN